MITSDLIDVYSKYNGDSFALDHGGSRADKEIVAANGWHLLAEFDQRLMIVNRGLASAEFAAQLFQEIEESCDSPETIIRLKEWGASRSVMPAPATISMELVNAFSKYGGDADELKRSGSREERTAATPESWAYLARLVRQQAIVNFWQASPEFAIQLNAEIMASCDSPQTADRLRQIVNR